MGGFRQTKSVKMFLDTFENSESAISLSDFLIKYQKEMNKTTVYRILERLESSKIIHSFIGKDGQKWFAQYDDNILSNKQQHSHFQCDSCGKSECLTIEVSIPKLPNHKIKSTNLLLIGECLDCTVE